MEEKKRKLHGVRGNHNGIKMGKVALVVWAAALGGRVSRWRLGFRWRRHGVIAKSGGGTMELR